MATAYAGLPMRDGYRVMQLGSEDYGRWEAFVADHPGGLIYHHPAWLQTLEREYGQRAMVLACEDGHGRILGVLPMMETRGLPFNVGRQFVGRRLASLPRTPVAGPLAIDELVATYLVQAAVALVQREPGVQLQLKVDSDSLRAAAEELVCTPWRLTYLLELPECPDQVRFGNSRNHARIKWAVNKATREGVVVRPAETEEDLRAWYQLYLDTMRSHLAPPRSYRFFQTCWHLLRPKGLMRLLLAELPAAGRARLLSGSIFLMFGHTVFYAFNGRRRESLSLRPNDAIHWNAIHDACQEGYRYYDFGEVVEDNQGLAEFKGKWGTEAKSLYRYYSPAPPSMAGEDGSAGIVLRLACAAWRRLPLRATALIGDRVYSFL